MKINYCLIFLSAFSMNVFSNENEGTIIKSTDCFENINSYESYLIFLENRNKIGSLSSNKPIKKDLFDDYKKNVNCQAVIFVSDNKYSDGFILKPKSIKDGKSLPGVLVSIDGNDDDKYKMDLQSMFFYHFPLAIEGAIVVTSQYRHLNDSYNLSSSIKLNDEFGGSDLADVVASKIVLLAQPGIDKGKISLLGFGRGSMMNFMLLKEFPQYISHVVSVAALVDLKSFIHNKPEVEYGVFERLIPNYHSVKDDALKSRSVSHWFGSLSKDPYYTFIHGKSDTNVPLAPVIKLADDMRNAGYITDVLILNDVHSMRNSHEIIINQIKRHH